MQIFRLTQIFFIYYLFLATSIYPAIRVLFPLTSLPVDTENEIRNTVNQSLREAVLEKIMNITEPYTRFPDAFSRYYGDATSLTNHLTLPIGFGTLSEFPSIKLGITFGSALTRSGKLRSEVGDELESQLPTILPTIGIGVNIGIGILKHWDIQTSIFPVANVSIPNNLVQGGNLEFSFKKILLKFATTYSFIGAKNELGLGLSGTLYTIFSSGSAFITFNDIPFDEFRIAGNRIVPEVTSTSNFKWLFYQTGAEVRLWYSLLFFAPYAGFGAGLQGGGFESNLIFDTLLEGSVEVDQENFRDSIQIVDEGIIIIENELRASLVPMRLISGLEFYFYLASLKVELQYDIIKRVLGVSMGMELIF